MTDAPSATVWDRLAAALSPLNERPRVVPGLECARHTTRVGVPYVVMRNPAANTYLKLEPREYDLLQMMDGTRTIPSLVLEDFKQHRVMAPARVLGLVESLLAQRFLTRAPLDAYALLAARLAAGGPAARLRGLVRAFLFSELQLPGVDAALERAYRHGGRLLFTQPAALLLSALAIAGPLFLGLEFVRGRYTLAQVRPESALLVVALFLLSWLVLALHELGHGLVVKHAGRHVPRGGLLLYYGFLGAYVDTTDIWMAPRQARLLTSFAGPFSTLVVGGLFALCAWLLPAGPLGAFLFVGACTFLVNNLLNFNPLLELDGYYLLVDWLEKPLLRAHSFAFVRGPLWSKLRRREKLTREETFLALFGLASAAWSGATLVLALQVWSWQIQGPVLALWQQGGWLGRAAIAAAAILVAIPVAAGLLGALRPLGLALGLRIVWLGRRWEARREAEALALLKQAPLWEDLPTSQALRLARALRVRDVPAGTELARQGEPCHFYFLVARGACEALVDGRPIRRLQPGEDFGKRALLDDAPQPASLVATQAARVYALDRASFRAALADDLERAVQLEAALSFQSEVGRMPLFQNLSMNALRQLLQRLQPVTFEAGATIIRPGDADDRFFVVRAGEAQSVQGGRRAATFGPGEAFGEDRLLDLPATVSVRAVTRVELLALRRADFAELLAVSTRSPAPGRPSDMEVTMHRRLDEVVRRIAG